MKNYLKVLVFVFVFMLPLVVGAEVFGTCNTSNPTGELCNPTHSGTLPEFVQNTMVYLGSIIGLLAIVMLVYAGIRIIMANGNDKVIGESKQTIYYTILGFIISVFAYAGVVAIENFIGVEQLDNTTSLPFNPLSAGSLQILVTTLMKGAMGIAGFIALLMIIFNGYRYMTARGDDKQIASAKSGLTWSLIGLAIILFAYVIISAVAKLIS